MKPRGGHGRRSDSGRVPAHPELEDDGRVPRVRERKRKERPALTGPRDGRREGNGPRKEKKERWAGGKEVAGLRGEKEKKRQRWAGLKEWEKEKRLSIFQNDSNTFKLNSNSKI